MGKHDKKQNKENLAIARVTTFIKGLTKKKFFEETNRTGKSESELANEILTKHFL